MIRSIIHNFINLTPKCHPCLEAFIIYRVGPLHRRVLGRERERERASLQVSKLETDVHIKAAAKKFHDVFCRRTHHIANVSPVKINGVDIHQGEWGSQGSIMFWNYVHGNQ